MARALWLKAHLSVGLAIAAPLIVVALSGSVLVFEDALDRALNPRLSYVTPGDQRDQALQISAATKPGPPFTIAIKSIHGGSPGHAVRG